MVSDLFGAGPVVVGPVASDLAQAYGSARAALSRTRAAVGWPEAPRRCSSDLLPERALAGDGHARRQLVDEVYLPLAQARGTLIETIAAYFQYAGLPRSRSPAGVFGNANTVRYRLRQVADLTGFSPPTPGTRSPSTSSALGRQSGRGV